MVGHLADKKQSILDFVPREGLYELINMVTDNMFKSEDIMSEFLLFEDEDIPNDDALAL